MSTFGTGAASHHKSLISASVLLVRIGSSNLSAESICVSSYCEEVGVDQTNDVVVYLPRIFEGILATMSRIPQSAFIWPLESLAILISVDENFVSTIESRLSPLAIELFVNYVQDPLINGETTA